MRKNDLFQIQVCSCFQLNCSYWMVLLYVKKIIPSFPDLPLKTVGQLNLLPIALMIQTLKYLEPRFRASLKIRYWKTMQFTKDSPLENNLWKLSSNGLSSYSFRKTTFSELWDLYHCLSLHMSSPECACSFLSLSANFVAGRHPHLELGR